MRKKLKIVLILICIIVISLNVAYAKNIDDNRLTIASIDSKISLQNFDGNKNNSFSNIISIGTVNSENSNILKVDSKSKVIDLSTSKIDSKSKIIKSITSRIDFKTKTIEPKKTPKQLSQDDIISASKIVNSYVSKYSKLPDSVKINGEKFPMAELLYLMSKTIEYKYKNSSSNVTVKEAIKNPARPSGDSLKTSLSFEDCYNTARGVISYISYNKIAPDNMYITNMYVENDEGYLGYMQYQTIIHSFAKLLSKKDINTEIIVDVKNTSKINRYMPKYARPGTYKNLNDKYTGRSAKEYLKATKNCQINNEAVKSLAKEITNGTKTKLQKATAIHDWVASNIRYDKYFNTKYGAVKTMNKRFGNCVDQTHLAIALYRASGIPARYVHGTCKFVSGNTVGHVWSQALVGKTWLVSDTTDYELNSLGTVNCWDSATYKLHGKHNSLSF